MQSGFVQANCVFHASFVALHLLDRRQLANTRHEEIALEVVLEEKPKDFALSFARVPARAILIALQASN